MKILLTGKNGQLGYELERSLQGLGVITALDRKQMDLSDLNQIREVIAVIKPDLIVNAAAYTAVDKAEKEAELAMKINGEAPAVIAEEARKCGAAMIHYSTDYVFNGEKNAPYVEGDVTCPINVYGQTKLQGEEAVLSAGIPYLIFRTSWVYGLRGNNFLLTMLRLAQERNEVSVVDDQYGAPTWSRTIADITAHIVSQSVVRKVMTQKALDWWQDKSGIYHLTAEGRTTWCEFARVILQNSMLEKKPVIKAIGTKDYPLPAKRPSNSVLSSEKLRQTFCGVPNWRDALELCQT